MPETPEQAKAREEAALGAQVEREIAAALGNDPDDDGHVPDVDAEQELPPADGVWSFGHAPAVDTERTPEDALDALLEILAEYREEERETVGPRDFAPFGKGSRIGRSRSWVSGKLGDLADEGVHLAETDEAGVYRLLYPEMATA